MKPIVFLITDQCNIKCRFCAPSCGPDLKTSLSKQLMIKSYDRMSQYGDIPLVVFTGGEPLLRKTDLCAVSAYISNIAPSTHIRIVTNVYWASTREKAKKTLSLLKNCGVTELNYSVDDFHQEFIPEKNIIYAVEEALRINIPVLLAHKTFPGAKYSRLSYEELLQTEISDFDSLSPDERGHTQLSISTGPTLPIGRGADSVDPDHWCSNMPIRANYMSPCFEVFQNVQISANGRLAACCGLVDRSLDVFYIGDLNNDDIIDILQKANLSLIYNWLALEGPYAIRQFILEKQFKYAFKSEYVQNCEICQEIFSQKNLVDFLYKHKHEIENRISLLRCFHEAKRRCLPA